jgi:hypothetical protein
LNELPETTEMIEAQAKARVDADVPFACQRRAMHATFSSTAAVTFGPWDEASFTDAMLGSLGHRARCGAGIRQLGTLHRRHPAAGHLVSRDRHQFEPGPGLQLSGTGLRPVALGDAVSHDTCQLGERRLAHGVFLVVGPR